jgi:hypothetical protein
VARNVLAARNVPAGRPDHGFPCSDKAWDKTWDKARHGALPDSRPPANSRRPVLPRHRNALACYRVLLILSFAKEVFRERISRMKRPRCARCRMPSRPRPP